MPPTPSGTEPCYRTELIALYYRLVPAEELSTAEPAELAAAVRSHLALAADRVPGRALVRLLSPTLAEDGWSSRDTVVQIVTDDMPYLVDSVVAELARINVSVRRLVHPIVVVRRDLTGTLQEVLPGSTPDEVPTDALAESWMYVNVDRITDPDRARLSAYDLTSRGRYGLTCRGQAGLIMPCAGLGLQLW